MFAPAATGLGDAASVTDMSALDPTAAVSVARSFNRLASLPPPMVAEFVKVAGADWETATVTVIAGYALDADKESDR